MSAAAGVSMRLAAAGSGDLLTSVVRDGTEAIVGTPLFVCARRGGSTGGFGRRDGRSLGEPRKCEDKSGSKSKDDVRALKTRALEILRDPEKHLRGLTQNLTRAYATH